MKKLCIALSLIFLLAGCASQQAANTPDPAPTATPEPTGNIFLDAEEQSHSTGFETKPVRYTIAVQKADAMAATPEEYSDFLSKRVEAVKSLGLAESYTMKFEDGTGVIYYGADPINAQYGTVDEMGGIVEPLGSVMLGDDGLYSYIPFDEEPGGDSETDATVQKLLENVYNIDGMETIVSVADGEANVWVSADISIPTEADKEALVSSFQSLYDAARDTMGTTLEALDTDSTYALSVTLCSSKSTPLYCIENGEVSFDLLTVG